MSELPLGGEVVKLKWDESSQDRERPWAEGR